MAQKKREIIERKHCAGESKRWLIKMYDGIQKQLHFKLVWNRESGELQWSPSLKVPTLAFQSFALIIYAILH